MASHYKWASVFVNGRRVAKSTDGSLSIKANGESVIDEDGWAGHTDGAITTDMSINRAIPKGGDGMSLEETLLKRSFIKVTWASLNGKRYQQEMVITDVTFQGDHASGKQTASLTASGGAPEIIG